MEVLIKGLDHHTVTEHGVVTNQKTGTVLTPNIRKNGYYLMTIWEQNKCYKKYLHRILAEAFIPNPEHKRTVNHKDGNKLNNNLSNLEWATHSENISHAHRTGLNKGRGILSNEQIKEAYKRFINHEPFAYMLKDYDISAGQLSYHISKYVKKHNLEDEYKAEVLHQIRMRAKNRKTSTTISKESTSK